MLVTANMDIFTDVVVPAHSLESMFDLVLNTADFGVLDKGVLWRYAFDTFGPGHDYGSALLIEDSPDAIANFRLRGGAAYQCMDDMAFANWLRSLED